MSRLKWMQCRKTKNWIDIIKKNKKYDIKAKTTHEHSHILKKTTMAKELRWTFNMYAMRVKSFYLHVYAQTRSPYEKNWFFAWLCLLWSVFFCCSSAMFVACVYVFALFHSCFPIPRSWVLNVFLFLVFNYIMCHLLLLVFILFSLIACNEKKNVFFFIIIVVAAVCLLLVYC